LKKGSDQNGTVDAGSVDNVADAASIGFDRQQWLPTKVNRKWTRIHANDGAAADSPHPLHPHSQLTTDHFSFLSTENSQLTTLNCRPAATTN
jgi:hypothetical protein